MKSVILTHYPADRKVSVIKVIRQITGMDLKTSKDLIEGMLPATVKDGIADALDADGIARQLEAVGATVQLRSESAPGVMSAKSTDISAELIKLRAGNARDMVRCAASLITVCSHAVEGDAPPAELQVALQFAVDSMDEVCDILDEANIAKPATAEERAELAEEAAS